MDLVLKRTSYRSDGIFGELSTSDGKLIAHTLEHAYSDGTGGWAPKIPDGQWTCQRGPHRLHGMTNDFITFEIMNVPGHDNLLFHWGNYNKDSEGCVLLGELETSTGGVHMVTNSRSTFAKFMAWQAGLNSFSLSVEA